MADRIGNTRRFITQEAFAAFLERNGRFHEQVVAVVSDLAPYPEPRHTLSMKSALLSIEHGAAAFVLISSEFHPPGFTLLRTQLETLVRGIWLMYAASDTQVEKLSRPLTVENADASNDTLMLAKMLRALRASESAPQAIVGQLEACRDVMWKALNSYTHGGFHPLARFETGYPPQLSFDVLRNSNALVALAAQLSAIVTGDQDKMVPVRALHEEFADCLPIIHS